MSIILKIVQDTIGTKGVVCDAFAGSTRVSQVFARSDYSVIANDYTLWAYNWLHCYINNPYTQEHFRPIFQEILSAPEETDGDLFEHLHYRFLEKNKISLLDLHHLKRFQGYWNRYRIMYPQLTFIERATIGTAFSVTLSRLTNGIAGEVQRPQKRGRREQRVLRLSIPRFIENSTNTVYNQDIQHLISRLKGDLIYFDPPYSRKNSYSYRYTFYKYFFDPTGDPWKNDLPNNVTTASDIAYLIHYSNFPYNLVSYSTNGDSSIEELLNTLARCGKIILANAYPHRNSINRVKHGKDQVEEILILVKKD